MTDEDRAYTKGYAQALRDIHTHIAYEWEKANPKSEELAGLLYKDLATFLEKLIASKDARLKETNGS